MVPLFCSFLSEKARRVNIETAKRSGPKQQHGTLDTSSGTPPRIRYSEPWVEPLKRHKTLTGNRVTPQLT